MTLHEDWHKAHPGHPCEYDTCSRGQVLDLENATYTAAEVKVLTAEARQGIAEEIAQALEAVPALVYPEDIFPPDGASVDCQSAKVMRFAYPAAAALAREVAAREDA